MLFLILISIVIWESFIKSWCEGSWSIWGVWVSLWNRRNISWSSFDHDWDGDIVVVRDVFLFISCLSSNWFECVITNDFSKCFKSNTVNSVQYVSWGNFKSKGSLLINWDGDKFWSTVEWLWFVHGAEGVIKVEFGFRSLFDHWEGLWDEGGSFFVLNSWGSWEHQCCKCYFCNSVHINFYYNL